MKNTARIPLYIFCLLVALTATGCATGPVNSDRATLLAEQFLVEADVSGFAATVGINGQIVWSGGFGFADLEQKVPVDPANTKFRVGSTAKSMTAMALGQLHERKQLDLDKIIQTYLPEFPEKNGPITTRMLAGHLAGIRHYKDDAEWFSAVHYDSVIDALEIFSADQLLFYPGTEFGYSTYGYNLISAVIERAADQDYLSYMSEKIFDPIGMKNTVPDQVSPVIANRSRYYSLVDGEFVNTPWVDNSNKWAGGGFLSTTDDLVRFGLAHLSGEFLAPETLEMMWTSQVTTRDEETGYGIGWGVELDGTGRKVIKHTGGSVGGITVLRVYPDHELVIAIVTNTDTGNVKSLANELVDLFLSKP